MANIHIHRDHTMGKAAARTEVEGIAKQLRSKLDIVYRWDGDELLFERPGANGRISVEDSSVTVDIDLGAGLSFFKGMVEGQINTYLDQRLQ